MAKLKAPENCSGLSHNGIEYEAKKGYVVVPDDNDLIMAAISHGFTTTGEADDEATQAQAAILAQAEEAARIDAEAKAQADAIASAEAEAAAKANPTQEGV